MSNPTCFWYDICALKVEDMECVDIVESEDSFETQDENQKIEKLKEAHLRLKKKVTLSHELIKQYNEKVQECQEIVRELESVKDNLKEITLKHSFCSSKIMKLEFENEKYKQKIEHSTEIVSQQENKIAVHKQHLQQLICKVQEFKRKEMLIGKTEKDDFFKDRIRTLETELKSAKDLHKLEIKQMEMKLVKSIRVTKAAKNQTEKEEIENINAKETCRDSELERVIVKPETMDRSTLTNEFYSIKDDPYPLFCSKCMIKLDPVPLDQIFKHMSACPAMVTEFPSPCKESEIIRPRKTPRIHSRTDSSDTELVSSNMNDLNQSFDSFQSNSDVSKSDFQRLERKICLLERRLHKNMKFKDIHPNSCCGGYPYPNNCYLGPYPNLFQPGAMIRSRDDLFEYQNWQQDFRNRKRSRRICIRKLNRHGTKLRKQRKLEDGTSEWNIDSVPGREFIDSNLRNNSDNDLEPSNLPLRTESPQSYSSYCNIQAPKFHEENESYPPLRKRGRKKGTPLFSTARSPPPRSQKDTDKEYSKKPRNESPKLSLVLNEAVSNEEVIRNVEKTPEHVPEYEPIQCVPKKRGRPPKNGAKTSAKKNSLVTKIRNLKKNCNKIKPLTSTDTSGSNNAKQPAVNGLTNLKQIKNAPILNNTDDFCPVKKGRVAHGTRKLENDCLCETNNRDSFERKQTNFANDSPFKDSAKINAIEKLDNCKPKVDVLEGLSKETLKPVGRKNSLTDTTDDNSSRLVETSGPRYWDTDDPMVAMGKIALCRTKMDTENRANDVSINISNASGDETINNKKDDRLQPYVMIRSVHLNVADAGDVCEENNESETPEERRINQSLNNDKININDAPLRILRSKTKAIKPSDKDLTLKNDGQHLMDKSSEIINFEGISRSMKAELIKGVNNVHPPETLNNEISNFRDKPEEAKGNAILKNFETSPVATVRKYKRRTRVQATHISPMRELRSRSIILSPSINSAVEDFVKDETELTENSINETPTNGTQLSVSEGFGPRALFQQLLTKRTNAQKQSSCSKNIVNKKLQRRKENLVLNELDQLCEDPDWKAELLFATIERLSKFKTHSIAKCTIDILVAKAEDDEKLDRTYTPPAPLLSKTQQRLLTMLVVLNRSIPNIIQLIQSGIVFRIFRLGYAPEVNVIMELGRMYTALARIQKDREKVRILCCDALYCLGLKAMPLIHTILISWPESFPIAGSSSDPLVLCIVNSIMTKTGDPSFPKFFALKKLLTAHYGYESSGYVINDLATKFMTTLSEKRQNGLDTAIILLSKQKGPDWAYNNIIQGGLLQMIINKAHPSIYDAFCLLGNIMRSFPIEDKKGLIKSLLEQLRALMNSGEGSIQQQEGVATAILSLSRHNQAVVINTLLNWKPSEPLSETTSRNLIGLFDNFSNRWWKNKLL